MPLHVPRTDTTKKREQLLRRKIELEHAIHSGLSRERVALCAEELRAAQLSLLKAELHWAEEAKLTGRDIHVDERIRNIQLDTQQWMEKTVDDILNAHATD